MMVNGYLLSKFPLYFFCIPRQCVLELGVVGALQLHRKSSFLADVHHFGDFP